MAVVKTTLLLLCLTVILSQTAADASARHHAIFDKFAALAQIKNPTTTTLPPATIIYIPTYPPLTNPTFTDSPTYTSTDNLDPATDTTTGTTTGTTAGTAATSPTITNNQNVPVNNLVTSTGNVRAVGTQAFSDDEDIEELENEEKGLEESDLSRQLRRQMQGRQNNNLNPVANPNVNPTVNPNRIPNRNPNRNRNRRRQNRRRANAMRRRQQKRRRQNYQIRKSRKEAQRLRRIIQQLRLRQQINNRKPLKIRIRYSNDGKRIINASPFEN